METNFKRIRDRLEMTQAAIGAALGVTQGNVSFYEQGQTVPPHIAAKLIEVARDRGVELTFDDIYGVAPPVGLPTGATPSDKGAKLAPQGA